MTAVVLALSLLLAQNATKEGRPDRPQEGTLPTPKDRGTAESSQRGSEGTTAGGQERTGAEFTALLTAAGLEPEETRVLPSGMGVITARRRTT